MVIQIQILNEKVDHVVGFGKKIRAERLQVSLNARLMLSAKLMHESIGMPKGDNESQHNSSDSEARIPTIIDSDGEKIPVSSKHI